MFKLMGRKLVDGKFVDADIIGGLSEQEATAMRIELDGNGYVAVWVEYDETYRPTVQVNYIRSNKFRVATMSDVRYRAAVAQTEINPEEVAIAVI
jgi:hypothetical protein